jgi:3-methyladenine DNA glycosylase/8-oxoguanine DNA glycosylase
MARAAALAYGLDEPLPPHELTRRAEAWRPYRSWVGVLLRLGLEDASHETRPHFEMHWRSGEPSRSRRR